MSELTVPANTGTTVTRSKVYELERAQLAMPQALDKMKLEVLRGHKTLARKWTIPAGISMTGAIQKFDCINVLAAGTINVLTADGTMQTVSAPWDEVTPAGTKRVGYTLTDCVWLTIYGTEETDPDKVAEMFTTNSEAEFLAHQQLQLKGA